MTDILAMLYPWTKALHVMAVIAWMAGLFYLPRLFVYHAEGSGQSPDALAMLEVMEAKLLRLIMNPAMVAVWVLGLALIFTPGVVDWSQSWPWVKAAAVLALTWFHHWLALRRKDFREGINRVSGRSFRLMNEVPTVLMIVIVVSVTVRF